MSGSDSKTERETEGALPSDTGRVSLADFLAPPRPRASVPPPENTAEDIASPPARTADTASPEAAPSATDVAASASDVKTPTEPTTVTEVAPRAETAVAAGKVEPRPSQAPPSTSDIAARSLIPVATGADSDATEDDGGDYDLPGTGPRLSGAAVRRVTFVALLAAAAAIPAWVVFRARSVDVPQRAEASASKVTAAGAGPSTLEPARVIEADDNADPPEPAAVAVPVDPVKALEARREARRLLEGGQIEPGVAAARNAIALNPADPESYVLLAAGLQDMGRWAESRDVFSRCVHKSKDGINAECAYFANSGTITNR
jgi:hypothetical protein